MGEYYIRYKSIRNVKFEKLENLYLKDNIIKNKSIISKLNIKNIYL